jgi:hypothetical protein
MTLRKKKTGRCRSTSARSAMCGCWRRYRQGRAPSRSNRRSIRRTELRTDPSVVTRVAGSPASPGAPRGPAWDIPPRERRSARRGRTQHATRTCRTPPGRPRATRRRACSGSGPTSGRAARDGVLVDPQGRDRLRGVRPRPAFDGLAGPQHREDEARHFRVARVEQDEVRGHAKQSSVQSVEHGFSVRPSGNFVSELPHASSNCVWNKFVAPRRMAPLRSVPRSLTPVRFATVRSAPLRLASFKLAPLRSAPSGWRRPGWRTSGRRRSGWRGSGRRRAA